MDLIRVQLAQDEQSGQALGTEVQFGGDVLKPAGALDAFGRPFQAV